MTHVGIGEQLASQGPSLSFFYQMAVPLLSFAGPQFYLPAAMSFYRALRIYPSAADLLGIYQKTIIEPVFKVRLFLPFILHCPIPHPFLS